MVGYIMLRERNTKLKQLLLNENKSLTVLHCSVYALLGVVSLIMAILNFITKKNLICWTTLAFTFGCAINLGLELINSKTKVIGWILFILEVIGLFTSFLISGNPDGFSALWILMIPSFGLLMFKRKMGSVFSLLMFLVLIAFLWTPLGDITLQYDYGNTFKMRFPILYIAFFALAFFFETVRSTISHEMQEARDRFFYLYSHDALTGTFNRYGFKEKQTDLFNERNHKRALAILDLDYFKDINDTYGHQKGDMVLQGLVDIIQSTIEDKAYLFRWGGDEFTLLFFDADTSKELCESFLNKVREASFDFSGNQVKITISIGLVYGADDVSIDVDDLIRQADNNLYQAKQSGRNCLIDSAYVKTLKKEEVRVIKNV